MRMLLLSVMFALLSACGGKEDSPELKNIKALYKHLNCEEAIPAIEAFLEERPEHVDSLVMLGNCQRKSKNPTAAKAAYEKALAAEPVNTSAVLGLSVIMRTEAHQLKLNGKTEEATKQFKLAAARLKRSLSVEELDPQVHTTLSLVLLDLGDKEKGLEHAQRAWKLDNKNAAVAANLAIAYDANNMPTERDEALENAEKNGYKKVDQLRSKFSQ